MNRTTAGLAALLLALGTTVDAQAPAAESGGVTVVSSRATGTFEVELAPVAEDREDAVASRRLALDKTFQGDLQGTSRGEMWTVDTGVEGSAGYVAIEKVSGTLEGRRGTFALLHQGTMRRGGDFELRVLVVPDSGTDELTGMAGRMAIVVDDGRHSYELEYSLPDQAR